MGEKDFHRGIPDPNGESPGFTTALTDLIRQFETSFKNDFDSVVKEAQTLFVTWQGEREHIRRELEEKLQSLEVELRKKGEELRDLLDERSKLEEAERKTAEVMAEAKRAQEFERAFRPAIEALQEKIKERDEIILKKEASLREMQERLQSRVNGLEEEIAEKERLLQTREIEMGPREPQGESDLLGFPELQRIKETLEEENEKLKRQLQEKEVIIHNKDTALQRLEGILEISFKDMEARISNLFREVEEKVVSISPGEPQVDIAEKPN